jgi:hypothetical protein
MLIKQRIVQEVPNRLETSLGTYYSFYEFCPVFYLNGCDSVGRSLPAREQRRARDEKVDQLARLNDGLILVAGIDNGDELADRLLDEFQSASDRLRILVCGIEDEATQVTVSRVGASDRGLLSRLRCDRTPLVELLHRIIRIQDEHPPDEPSVKVGSIHIPLAPLLVAKLDPPLDQFFEILTSDFIRPASDAEDVVDLREQLVRGQGAAWRAFAHDLQWSRNKSRVESIEQILQRDFVKDGPLVININVIGERGSGLTTCLHEIAFRLATLGYPTLVHRLESPDIDYDSLRMFFERLDDSIRPDDSSGLKERGIRRVIPALIFDNTDSTQDAVSNLRQLPMRLANDGRMALIVRGIAVRDANQLDTDFRAEQKVDAKEGKVKEIWLDTPLLARLIATERQSLEAWAKKSYDSISLVDFDKIINNWGQDWPRGVSDSPPLLICLYFVLHGQITASAQLGRHLLARLRPVLSAARAHTDDLPTKSSARPLDDQETAVARELLLQTFETSIRPELPIDATKPYEARHSLVEPTRRDIANVVALLSALGVLRLGISRKTLGVLSEIQPECLIKILVDLESCDIASADLGNTDNRSSPSAFYNLTDKIGLRHPAYGRLILEWLACDDGQYDLGLFDNNYWLGRFLSIIEREGLGPYPIWLLEPILEHLGPTSAEVNFVEEISTRFLRIQKLKGSDYHKWMYGKSGDAVDQRERVHRLFECIAEEVVRQRSVILHSRGMTRYKSCRASTAFDECTNRYSLASKDFDLAVARAGEEMAGENPANVITSKGLSYMFRANLEREQASGSELFAREADDTAHACLREALEYRRDNSYAAYGLAEFLINRCERVSNDSHAPDGLALKHAANLAEACELLQLQPTDAYRTEWEELWKRLVWLLSGAFVAKHIRKLKEEGDELGYALEALCALRGRIPTEITADVGELFEIESAGAILTKAAGTVARRSPLASLLRYALFTAHQDRIVDPAYKTRYDLIMPVQSTVYMHRSIWLFDYGMLSLQMRQIQDGLDAFRKLRQGRRFFDVPLERSVFLAKNDNFTEPQQAIIRVSRIDQDGKGWARPDNLEGFTETIPFSVEDFKKQTTNLQYGRAMSCFIRIRPAGPFAVPLDRWPRHKPV